MNEISRRLGTDFQNKETRKQNFHQENILGESFVCFFFVLQICPQHVLCTLSIIH